MLSPERSGIIGKPRDYNDYCCLWKHLDFENFPGKQWLHFFFFFCISRVSSPIKSIYDMYFFFLYETFIIVLPIQHRLRTKSENILPSIKPKDHWSCIAQLSAEYMLKSAVIEEKKLKHSPWAGVDNPLGQNFYLNRKASSLWSFVASLKGISSTSDFIYIFFII